jgi:hypothetical protein
MIPDNIKYTFHNVNGFKEIVIINDSNKFIIGYIFEINNGLDSLYETQNALFGTWAYLSEKKEINSFAIYFSSYEECIEVIKKRTPEKLTKLFKQGEVENNNYLLSLKTN